jgi:uncharacterized protein
MTQPSTAHRSFLREIRNMATTVAIPHHEPPGVILRRRVVVATTVVIGAVLLGYSMTREPGDTTFNWLMLALAAVWTVGAFASGPLHLGSVCFRGRNQRPVITGTATGLALGALFVVGGLIAEQIPGVSDYVSSVLQYAGEGAGPWIVLLTLINGFAEELFFRGALYTALIPLYPAVVSTILYVAAMMATGNPMLGFAAIILGAVCAFERRATGGVLAPILTHVFWGLIMVLALPSVFAI